VGLFPWFGRVPTPAAEVLAPSRRARIASPWSPGMSATIMAAEWLGADLDLVPVSRDQAMRVPAVVAARNILCTTLAQGALKAFRGSREIPAPAWCYRTNSDIPPQLRLLWTVDDLLFGGFSLWWVSRAAGGQLLDAVRVPPERWTFDPDGAIRVDDESVDRRDVILFTGWDEGLLTTGADAIRDALKIAKIVRTRVQNPTPVTVIQPTDPTVELTDGSENEDDNEQRTLVEGYIAARSNPRTGGVMYLPWGLAVEDRGAGGLDLLEAGRNASTLEIARLTGVPAALLEASQVSASLTYQTDKTVRSILNDRVRARAQVIEAWLSMDDVTPRGTRIALDLSHLTTTDDGLPAETED
jgi:hypothetical protein